MAHLLVVTAAKVVVYDNVCHLVDYVFNREPAFFKDTLFFVDTFHWSVEKYPFYSHFAGRTVS